jgi:hypothetical protein
VIQWLFILTEARASFARASLWLLLTYIASTLNVGQYILSRSESNPRVLNRCHRLRDAGVLSNAVYRQPLVRPRQNSNPSQLLTNDLILYVRIFARLQLRLSMSIKILRSTGCIFRTSLNYGKLFLRQKFSGMSVYFISYCLTT